MYLVLSKNFSNSLPIYTYIYTHTHISIYIHIHITCLLRYRCSSCPLIRRLHQLLSLAWLRSRAVRSRWASRAGIQTLSAATFKSRLFQPVAAGCLFLPGQVKSCSEKVSWSLEDLLEGQGETKCSFSSPRGWGWWGHTQNWVISFKVVLVFKKFWIYSPGEWINKL
jgi:hypothetical protein